MRAGVREQRRQRGEGHRRRGGLEVGVGLGAGEEPGGAAEPVHAEAPITLANSQAAARGPSPRAARRSSPAAKASPAPDGSTTSTRRGGQLERLVAARGDEPALAQRDDHGAGAELEEALGLPARVALSRQRGRLVVVRHEVVDLGQDARDVVERERPARRDGDVEHDRACRACRARRSCSASSSCRRAGSTR